MNDLSQMEFFQTLSAEDSPARISRSQEIKRDLAKKQGQGYGQSAPDYLGKFDQNMPSLKTLQHCLTDQGEIGLSEFSGTFPRSGMMQSGTVYQLPNLARTITEIGYGLLHTPTAKANQSSPSMVARNSGYFPTPVSSDATTGQIIGKNDTFKTTKNGNLRKYNSKGTNGSLGLARHVQFFPTPTASDYKGGYNTKSLIRKDGKSRAMDGLPNAVLDGKGTENSLKPISP